MVMRDLTRYGPDAPPQPSIDLDGAFNYVRALSRHHRENFHVLSRFVPIEFRDDFAAIYAFCRWADDLGDETGNTIEARDRAITLLAWWRGLLHEAVAYAQEDGGQAAGRHESSDELPRAGLDHQSVPTHPVMVALADTIRRRGLSPQPFHDLIDAFEHDQRVLRYRTWEQLIGYCRKSADPVGRIVLQLAGCDPADPANAPTVAQSDAICTALQLTNLWQDVRRDLLERDRIYLPIDEVGFGESELRQWISNPYDAMGRVRYIWAVRGLVNATKEIYCQGRELPLVLGTPFGRVVHLFITGGESTLRAIERAGCTTLWARPKIGAIRRGILIASALLAR